VPLNPLGQCGKLLTLPLAHEVYRQAKHDVGLQEIAYSPTEARDDNPGIWPT
jgi:hypothetical protein